MRTTRNELENQARDVGNRLESEFDTRTANLLHEVRDGFENNARRATDMLVTGAKKAIKETRSAATEAIANLINRGGYPCISQGDVNGRSVSSKSKGMADDVPDHWHDEVSDVEEDECQKRPSSSSHCHSGNETIQRLERTVEHLTQMTQTLALQNSSSTEDLQEV